MRLIVPKLRDAVWAAERSSFNGQFSFTDGPIAEQRRIVALLYALAAKNTALKLWRSQSATELEVLLPSILDRPFKGGL